METFEIIEDREQDNSIGEMGSIIQVNGKKVANMEVDYGIPIQTRIIIVTPILVSGEMEEYKAMEFIRLSLIRYMKDSSRIF